MIAQSDVQGHWVRDWIKAPGVEDHTTRVHWMQAGLDYADMRIPLTRPDLGHATCLADLPAPALADLARAEGFAGHVSLAQDQITWHCEINWHGTPEAPDVGAIRFDDQGRMIEEGVLAEYTELWSQRATAETRALRFGNETYHGVFVLAREIGVLGLGRPSKPATKPILDALKRGVVPDNVDLLFDGLHALCRVSGDRVIATLATDPFAEGTTVLTLQDGAVIWHRSGFDGRAQTLHLKADKAMG